MGTQVRANRSKANRKPVQLKPEVDVTPVWAPEIGDEIGFLKNELTALFKMERWPELSEALLTVARLGEGHAQKELCLKSQNLRQLVGSRTLKYGSPQYHQVAARFEQLMFHLSHLHWTVGNSKEPGFIPPLDSFADENAHRV